MAFRIYCSVVAKMNFWLQTGNKKCLPKPITVAAYLQNISCLHPTKLREKVRNSQETEAKSCKPLLKGLDWTHQEDFYNKREKIMEGFFLYTYTTLECYYNSDWLMRFITQKTALLLFSIGESGSEMLHFYCQVSRQRHIKTWPLTRLDSCRCFTVLFLPPDNEEVHDF